MRLSAPSPALYPFVERTSTMHALINAHRRTLAALSIAIWDRTERDGKAVALCDYRQAISAELVQLARQLPADEYDRAVSPINGMASADVFDA